MFVEAGNKGFFSIAKTSVEMENIFTNVIDGTSKITRILRKILFARLILSHFLSKNTCSHEFTITLEFWNIKAS